MNINCRYTVAGKGKLRFLYFPLFLNPIATENPQGEERARGFEVQSGTAGMEKHRTESFQKTN
ncbi:hypothetical protein EZJ43_14060 [Pedobacter changchengzhani]|uniref:Uncharacterized protein n=1 Tax=Pedobacter changchengzhani TaxID=2529274 RepID=A0A4R5MII2_9SPHI|nr:hypothetical protein [Pedobacter changchengzhani]TDG35417.1 hypothetical protein EZJ43_14060 [Pedobacter changchengzhani]